MWFCCFCSIRWILWSFWEIFIGWGSFAGFSVGLTSLLAVVTNLKYNVLFVAPPGDLSGVLDCGGLWSDSEVFA